jgi:hypothetical protein
VLPECSRSGEYRARVFVGVSRATLARLVVLAVVVLCIASAFSTPSIRNDRDPAVYRDTLLFMRQGHGYYQAAELGLEEHHIGPVASARGMRLPTVFLLWRLVGGLHAVWLLYLALVVVGTTVAAILLVRSPLLAALPALYLFRLGRDAYPLTELWAVPFVAWAMAATAANRPRLSAALSTVATAIRELAFPILVGGLVVALHRRRDRWAWVAGMAVVVAVFAIHSHLASPFLRSPGNEAPLLGSGRFPSTFVDLLGFNLVGGAVIGPALFALAIWQLLERGWLVAFGPFFALGFVGLLVDRPYWGAMLVPLTLLLGGQQVVDLISPRIRSLRS